MRVKLIFALSLVLLLLVFTLQNTQTVPVRFLFWKVELSRVLWIGGVLGVGFVLGRLSRTRLRP